MPGVEAEGGWRTGYCDQLNYIVTFIGGKGCFESISIPNLYIQGFPNPLQRGTYGCQLFIGIRPGFQQCLNPEKYKKN